MSYKNWIEYAELMNDEHLKDWAIRKLASTSELIDLAENRDNSMKFNLFKALMLRNTHGTHVFRECSIFGKDEIANKKICQSFLNQNDGSATPRLKDIYKNSKINVFERVHISIVMAKHINCSSEYIESDLYYHYLNSAKEAGHFATAFDASNIMYSHHLKTNNIESSLLELETFFTQKKTDIVLTDGNFVPSDNTITSEIWISLKQKYNFKIVIIIADCYDSQPDFYKYWVQCADLIICFNRKTSNFRIEEKSIYCPCVSFYDKIFKQSSLKDKDLLYIGSNFRNRLAWIQGMSLAGINTYAILHERKKPTAPDHEEYGRLMSESKLVFNNGWVNESDNILTGRFFEGILSESVVIQEVGTNADEFFVPFKHYIPVSNIKQAIVFAKYLIENEETRNRIAKDAYKYYQENYSSNLFWTFLLSKVNSMV